MSISFNNVSPSSRASQIFIEMAGEKKSLSSLFIPPTGLIIGMYDPLKTSVVDYIPIKVVSADDVGLKAGFGSHAHRQALKFPAATFLQGNGVYWVPVPEESGGTAASETVTFAGPATSSGTISLSIGGELVEIPVTSGDTAIDIAANFVDEVTAIRNIAVTAAVPASSAVSTLTCKFKGTQGNQILVVQDPAGDSQEEAEPTGVTVTLGNVGGRLGSGATDPDLNDVFFNTDGTDKLGDRWYTALTMPFVGATDIADYKASAALRADPAVNRFFGAYAGYVDKTYAQALALPATINDKYIGQIYEDEVYYPDFELSAALVGIILDEQNKAPNRPVKTISLSGLFNPAKNNRRYVENDALFRAGIGYCNLVGSSLQLGDIPLTYRTNPLGGDATDWYDAQSLHTRQAKAYSIEQLFKTEKYQRSVIVSNSDVTAVDYAIAPKDVISDLTKLVTDLWGPQGWSKNIDTIIEGLTAEINSSYEGRIDSKITDDEAKALRIIAVKYAFLY